jgi:hypothetical protein
MSNRNKRIHAGAQTATGNSGPIKATSATIALSFDVTVFEGTAATMDITVQWSPDGTNFADKATPDAIAQITATGVYHGIFAVTAAYYRIVYTMGGDVIEIQTVTHDHDAGTFTLSFDGEGPTADLDWDCPVTSVAAEGLLTVAVQPVAAVAAQGTLTIQADGDDGRRPTDDARCQRAQRSHPIRPSHQDESPGLQIAAAGRGGACCQHLAQQLDGHRIAGEGAHAAARLDGFQCLHGQYPFAPMARHNATSSGCT